MKENGISENLYFNQHTAQYNHERRNDDDIEYTRTDAIIEKAMKFLYDYNKNMVKKHGSRAVLGCSEFTINVYDFRKYMEGK